MFSENFWELFTETGDIDYYLLYRESDGTNTMQTTEAIQEYRQ